MREVDIYWNDLSEEKQQELLEAGLDNVNITDEVFPVTTVYFEEHADLIYEYETKIAKAKRNNDTEAQYYYQDKLDELFREDVMNSCRKEKKK